MTIMMMINMKNINLHQKMEITRFRFCCFYIKISLWKKERGEKDAVKDPDDITPNPPSWGWGLSQ